MDTNRKMKFFGDSPIKKKKLKLKVVIDKKKDKVLFAEADRAFVDFLIYTLSLPLTAVAAYLPAGAPGSVGNLRRSLEKLDKAHYVQKQKTKSSILLPHLLTHVSDLLPRLTDETYNPVDKIFYRCPEAHSGGHDVVTDVEKSVCGVCHREMTRQVKFSDSSVQTGPRKYVKYGLVKYMVTDQLSVLPLDSSAVLKAVKGCGDVMEKYVEFGPPKALDLLKAVVL